MKLRCVLTENGPQVEALQSGSSSNWIRLSTLDSIDKNDSLANSILSVLALGPDGWQALSEQVDACSLEKTETKSIVTLPFQPLSFRDFLLFEQHCIDASRGFVKRFLPKKYKMTQLYERVTGKTYPKFKPAPLWYKHPLYYFGNHLNFVTSGHDIHVPDYSDALDYELELGAILAKPLLNATAGQAEQAIGGYAVLNDLSARDVQIAEMRSGFGPQKAKHFLNAISPIIVTADEINDKIDRLQASVNIDGIIRANCTTENMQYSLAEAIAYASKSEQLHPGELFGSGTLPGGSGMENGHWLQSGNVLTLKIDAVGELVNRMV